MKINNIIRYPDTIEVTTDTGIYRKEGVSQAVFEEVKIDFTLGVNLDIYLTGGSTGVKKIKLFWHGVTGSEYFCLGDAWERGYGDLEWLPVGTERHMPWYFFVSDKTDTAAFGVRVRPAAICSWECFGDMIILTLDVRCGGNGVILDGRRLQCVSICKREYKGITPFEASCRFPRILCDDGIFPENPVYGSNNWYYAYGDITEESVLQDSEYIAFLTKGLENRPFMVIDDGWQKYRNALGPFTPNSDFPDMKKLAGKISAMDVRPGIWVRLLSDKDGVPDGMELKRPGSKNIYDPSHPGALAKVMETVSMIRDWGYELLKHDYSTFDMFGCYGFSMTDRMTDDGWSFYDKSRTSAEIIIDFYREIKKTFGGLVLGCNCIGHLCAGIHELNRTGDDTSGREWAKTLKMGVNTLAFRMGQHKAFYDVDADCIGITDMIEWDDNKKWLDLLARSGTPLFMSSRMGTSDPEQVEEIKRAMARSSRQEDVLIPVDWMEKRLPGEYISNGEKISYKF